MVRLFSHTLAVSTSFIRSNTDRGVGVAKEEKSCTKEFEFSSEVADADAFEKHVELAMHDHDYLRCVSYPSSSIILLDIRYHSEKLPPSRPRLIFQPPIA